MRHLQYFGYRIVLTIPVLLGVSIVVFSMLHLAPGDPAQAMLGPRATPDTLAALRERLGLNQSLPVQYIRWLGNILVGDFGRSIQLGRPVLPEILEKFGNSSILAAGSFVFASVGGILIGILAAVRRNSWVDRSVMLLSSLGISTPPFWLGILLIAIFAINLGWFPSSGMFPIQATGNSLPALLHHMVLPAITLGAAPLAVIARMTRSSMLEVLGEDYIRAARAKGLSSFRVIFQHAFRNAFAPILTILGLQVGILLAAAVLTEIVFSWPGIGTLMIDSILTRDLPLTQGTVLIIAAVYVISNAVVDTLYSLNDPRIEL